MAKPHTLVSILSQHFSMPNNITHMETMNSNNIDSVFLSLKANLLLGLSTLKFYVCLSSLG